MFHNTLCVILFCNSNTHVDIDCFDLCENFRYDSMRFLLFFL